MTCAKDPLRVCIKDDGKELHLVLEGELDLATVPVLLDCFRAGVSSGVPEDVCLDVSSLDFCDSSGLSLLVTMQKRAQPCGTKFTIRFPNEHFLKLLKVTGLTGFFDLRDCNGDRVSANDD